MHDVVNDIAQYVELAKVAKLLVEWIKKNGTSYTMVLVTEVFVNVCSTDIGVSIKFED
ncbi:hypothetical protein [Veillonella sp. AS16]|uniref:hypothetical protein n=1 Tax=Veillonella sp. AS16 TaxID=936589 RepID=UPI0003E1D38A|nr:hypothetical protein [Veillonella sp. AS16]ETS91677.1 hypothetical protein HMPREF1521_1174 [Veillonella sp. AS16]